jgi:hypothetical protein
MGSCCTPDAPTPPNPFATAAAQTGTNVSTALANSYLGNVNQVTPQGTLTNNVTGNYNFTDPASGANYNIPRWTSTQSLLNPTQYLQQNPDVLAAAKASGQDLNQFAMQHYDQSGRFEGRYPGTAQDTYNTNEQSKLNMAQMANQQSGSLKGLLGTPFNPTASAPMAGDYNWIHMRGLPTNQIAQTDPYAKDYASGGDIQDTYGPTDNFSADRQRIEQSMFERVNPQLQQDESRLRQQLADQGIRYGSQAYQGAYDPYNRQVTDTRLGIVAAGGAEQQRMNQMAQQQAQFGNQAQAQREGQNAARAAFGNQAAQSQFEQAAQRGAFFNQGQAQDLAQGLTGINTANQIRNQYLQEQYQQRAQPINEITALMSGSQVSQPNFINASKTQIPTTDVAGLINQNFAQQNDIYKTQSSQWGDIAGGALGAAGQIGKGYMMSDVRAKENIAPMGSVMTTKGELPMYEYDYKAEHDDGKRHFGPMAQDVEKLDPKAVKQIDGLKHIKREKLASIFGSA